MAGIWDDALATYQQQPGQLPPQFAPQMPPQPIVAPPMPAPVVAPLPAPVVQVPPQELAPVPGPPQLAPGPVNFDDSIRGYRQSVANQMDATRAHAAAQATGAGMLADSSAQQVKEIEANDAKFAPDEAAIRASRAETLQQYKDESAKNANLRAVDSRTTGQRVMGTLGVALAGLGDAMSKLGGHTDTHYAASVTQQINQQVERDLASQREAIEGKHKHTASLLTEMGLANQFLGDTKEAKAYAASQIQLKYAAKTRELTARSDNEVVRAGGEMAAAQLETQAKQVEAALIEKHDDAKLRAQVARAAAGVKAGTGAPKILTKAELVAKAATPEGLTGPEAQQLDHIYTSENHGNAPGKDATAKALLAATHPEIAATEPGAQLTTDLRVADSKIAPLHAKNVEKMQAGIDSARNLIDKIDRIVAIRKEHGVKIHVPYSDARSDVQQIHGDAVIDAKNVAELGALSGPDMGLVNQMIGDPTDLSSAAEAKYGQAKYTLMTKVNGQAARRGFEPVFSAEEAAAAKGNEAPRAKPSASPNYGKGGTPGAAAPRAEPPLVRKAPIFGKKVGS